jgi:hypothetical protein
MKLARREPPVYKTFKSTYEERGAQGFDVTVLLLCAPENLLAYEAQCISAFAETINSYKRTDSAEVYSAEEKQKRSGRAKMLWAIPEYREKAIASRKGKAYNKGYKCTPEQVENRKKAARISNMKRNYGEAWREEYARRYPEFVGDLDGR